MLDEIKQQKPTNKNFRSLIKEHMTKKGWKLAGQGGYAMVFISPDKQKVIKVHATETDGREKDPNFYKKEMDKSEAVTGKFLKFIEKNKNNPHLPRFFKTKKDKVAGVDIILYEMEPLKEITSFIEKEVLLEFLEYAHGDGSIKDFFEDHNENDGRSFKWLASKEGIGNQRWLKYVDNWPEFKKDFEPLISIMAKLIKVAKNSGGAIEEDIEGNWMKRSDGTYVIMDPWMPEFDWS